MATLWIVSQDPVLCGTLSVQLGPLGDVFSGPPERAAWRGIRQPDLVVVGSGDTPSGDLTAFEQLLGFLRSIPHEHHAPAPILYIEPPGGHPAASLARSCIDDRPLRCVRWPADLDLILEHVQILLQEPQRPIGLRERARREWVTERVEIFYAELDQPALRHAIDPRNAARPVLLLGEPGTQKGLLARYIHNLAEPPRDALIPISVAGLELGQVEAKILELCAGRRTTLYLQGLGNAQPGLQEELANFLTQGGVQGIESIRWIGSAHHARELVTSLKSASWLRVELPSLRERSDLDRLARSMTQRLAERAGREIKLGDDALEILSSYGWPGNLRELESVVSESLGSARGPTLSAPDIRLGFSKPSAAGTTTPIHEPESAPKEYSSDVEAKTEPEPALEPAQMASLRGGTAPDLLEVLAPLAQEVRQPLLAIRTYASLLDQRPDDPNVRRELASLVEGDLNQLEELMAALENFAGFGEPKLAALDLAAVVNAELDRRQARSRERSLVVLRELDEDAPPALGDEGQMGFSIGVLLDRALRMVPSGGDLYVGSHYHPAQAGREARHRLLIRFHSPEDVLVAPDDAQGPKMPLEVLMARALTLRMHGSFAVDSSGSQDNVILIELPC